VRVGLRVYSQPFGAPFRHDDRGVNYLLSLQASEGYWMGERADTTLESDYIFYLKSSNKANPERIASLRIMCAAPAQ